MSTNPNLNDQLSEKYKERTIFNSCLVVQILNPTKLLRELRNIQETQLRFSSISTDITKVSNSRSHKGLKEEEQGNTRRRITENVFDMNEQRFWL